MEPTKHQYDHDAGGRPRLPRPPWARRRVQAQHRGEPRHARRALLPPRDRLRDRARPVRLGRCEPRRPAERLGHRPVPELCRGPRAADVRDREGRRAGNGGFNFDAKLRRQSIDRIDLFHAHIGGIDTLARALIVAAKLADNGDLARMTDERYAGWDGDLGRAIKAGGVTLAELADQVEEGKMQPRPCLRQTRGIRKRRQRRPLGLAIYRATGPFGRGRKRRRASVVVPVLARHGHGGPCCPRCGTGSVKLPAGASRAR